MRAVSRFDFKAQKLIAIATSVLPFFSFKSFLPFNF